MRLVNAIPAVVEGEPGLLTALDLPPVYGRGLVGLTPGHPPGHQGRPTGTSYLGGRVRA